MSEPFAPRDDTSLHDPPPTLPAAPVPPPNGPAAGYSAPAVTYPGASGAASPPPGYPAFPQGGYATPGVPGYPQGGYAVPPGYPAYPNYPNYPGYPPGSYAPLAAPSGGYPAPNAAGTPPVGYVAPSGYPVYPSYAAPPGYFPGYGYPYPFPYAITPPNRDTYRQVVGILALIGLGLLLIAGLLSGVTLPTLVSLNSQAVQSLVIMFLAFALGGGGVGVFFAIRALMGRGSAPVRLPTFLLPLGLTVAVLGVGIAQYDLGLPVGAALTQTLMILLAGILPTIAVFTLAGQRLGFPSTWRRVWLTFLTGMFLSSILAIIIEFVLSLPFLSLIASQSVNVNNLNDLIGLLLVLSVIAPLVEESLKPIGVYILLGRIRGPSEAFWLGMAGGAGFNIFETTSYIGTGAGTWIVVAMDRVGTSLLHSVGAGLTALGWYYLVRGKGAHLRFLKGFGAIVAAIVQHGVFNGLNLLVLLPGTIGQFLSGPIWFFGLQEQGQVLLAYGSYAVMIGVLLVVTDALRRSPLNPTAPPVAVESAAAPLAGNTALGGAA